MGKQERDKIMLAEHVLEVRHLASGTFLDVRGFVADYIRDNNFLPHWKIENNVVNFHDQATGIKTEGAFVGYKSAGYVVINSQTHNFFIDRASAFWRLLMKNTHYTIPSPLRFGTRSKVFIPSGLSFEQINKILYETFFTELAMGLFNGIEKDMKLTINTKEGKFDVHLGIGPINKNEAPQYFQFNADELNKTGLFLDIDIYKTNDINIDNIPALLEESVGLMWQKVEKIATGLGF